MSNRVGRLAVIMMLFAVAFPSGAQRAAYHFLTAYNGADSVIPSGTRRALNSDFADRNGLAFEEIPIMMPGVVSLDTSKVVGSIPYAVSTSDKGALTLDVPIEVPTIDFENAPSLSIHYSSQASRTFMGLGWSLQGIPMISRVNKTYFTDRKTSGITFDENDAFEYNGQRLIYLSQNEQKVSYAVQCGQTRAVHDLATDYFTVYLPDGAIILFENNDGINYYPSYKEFPDGSRITYTFINEGGTDNHSKLLERISYGNERKIVFDYLSRGDTCHIYVAGLPAFNYHKLQRINIMNNSNDTLSYYQFYYESMNKMKSPVERIEHGFGGGNDKRVNPLTFHYNYSNYVVTSPNNVVDSCTTVWHFQTANGGYFPAGIIAGVGHFNEHSDEMGYFLYPNKDAYHYNQNGNFYYNAYTSSDVAIVSLSSQYLPPYEFNDTIHVGADFIDAFAIDVDHDGQEELVTVNSPTSPASLYETLTFNVYKQGAFSWSRQAVKSFSCVVNPLVSNGGALSRIPRSFLVGDFDGDGKEDLLSVSISNPLGLTRQSSVHFYNMHDKTISGTFTIDRYNVYHTTGSATTQERWTQYKNSDKLFVLDYNGDGKQEFAIIHAGGISVYEFTKEPDEALVLTKVAENTFPSLSRLEDYRVNLGDFNGDGVSDLFLSMECRSRPAYWYRLYHGRGDGGYNHATSRSFTDNDAYAMSVTGASYTYMVMDFNSDSKSDIISICYDNTKKTTLNFSTSGSSPIYVNGECLPIPSNRWWGIGRTCLLAMQSGGRMKLIRNRAPSDWQYAISGITDSYGNAHSFKYARLAASNMNTVTLPHAFPYASMNDGRLVCSNHVQRSRAGAIVSNVSMSYEDGAVHRQGLGFCGFSKITTTDSLRTVSGLLSKSVATFSPEQFNVPKSYEDAKSMVRTNYSTLILPDRRIRIHPVTKVTLNKLTNHADSVICAYDGYDNVTNKIAYTDDGWVTATRNLYYNYFREDRNLIGLRYLHEVTVIHDGDSIMSGMFTHHNNLGQPLFVNHYVGSASNTTSSRRITYHTEKHLPLTIEDKRFNSEWLKQTIAYKPSASPSTISRVPQSVKDVYDHTSYIGYDDWGIKYKYDYKPWLQLDTLIIQPLEPGHRGDGTDDETGTRLDGLSDIEIYVNPLFCLKTKYERDATGCVVKATAPDGAQQFSSRHWCGDDLGLNALYYVESSSISHPTTRIYYNSLGNVVREEQQCVDGSFLKTDYTYDNLGRLQTRTLPYKTGVDGIRTIDYTYDQYDRPLMVVNNATDREERYTYNGPSVRLDVNGVLSTKQTRDALGHLTRAEDGGGYIDYTYRPDGQPSQIAVNGSITTTFEYDQYGRRTAIVDPSAGRRSFTYDNAGNLNSVTDARGETVACTFDKYGAMTSKAIGTEIVASYTYDEDHNLLTMSDNQLHDKSYVYDNLLRLKSDEVDGFKREYTYGNNGLVSAIGYSYQGDSIATEHEVWVNGSLKEVNLGTNRPIWRVDEIGDNGLPTIISNKALVTTLEYDAGDNVTWRNIEDTEGSTVASMAYEYDTTTGNMSWQEDENGNEGQYEYDTLNRLTGYDHGSVTYDNKGNITSKSGAGTLGYGGDSPYAVATLADAGAQVPRRNQTITYNALQRPSGIAENGVQAQFRYNGDGELTLMDVESQDHVFESFYFGDRFVRTMGHNGGVQFVKDRLWLGGSPYNAPAVMTRTHPQGPWTLHYVQRDNVGSIAVVTDSCGVPEQRLTYDAWGALKDNDYDTVYAPGQAPELLTRRGFGSHEHLPWFGLVNMNARLYEPATGRFLSPDPGIQLPTSTQNFNRYSYCLNNPLIYRDPTGENIYFMNGDETYSIAKRTDDDWGIIMPELVVMKQMIYWATSAVPSSYLPCFYSWQYSYLSFNRPPIFNGNVSGGGGGGGGFGGYRSSSWSNSNYNGINDAISASVTTTQLYLTTKANIQYNDYLEIWKGKNNKIYYGLKGRGPNQYTGSRKYAINIRDKFNSISRNVTIAYLFYSTFNTVSMYCDEHIGPNVMTYETQRFATSNSISLLGTFAKHPLVHVFASGYAIGELLDIGMQYATDGAYGLQYNPYTHDFTPIEQTLMRYDEEGVYIY